MDDEAPTFGKFLREFLPWLGRAYYILGAVVLICHRAFGVIDWPWWLVLLPIWGPAVILVVWYTIVGVLVLGWYRR